MGLLLTFAGIFAIYDAIRRVNNNILKQTEEVKKLRDEFNRNDKNLLCIYEVK